SPSARWIFTFGFCLSILSAYGLDGLARELGKIPLVLAAIAAAFGGICLLRLGPFRLSSRASLETLVGFAVIAAAAFVAGRRPRTALGLCLAGLLVELFPHFLAYNAHADASALRTPPEPVEFVRKLE